MQTSRYTGDSISGTRGRNCVDKQIYVCQYQWYKRKKLYRQVDIRVTVSVVQEEETVQTSRYTCDSISGTRGRNCVDKQIYVCQYQWYKRKKLCRQVDISVTVSVVQEEESVQTSRYTCNSISGTRGRNYVDKQIYV